MQGLGFLFYCCPVSFPVVNLMLEWFSSTASKNAWVRLGSVHWSVSLSKVKSMKVILFSVSIKRIMRLNYSSSSALVSITLVCIACSVGMSKICPPLLEDLIEDYTATKCTEQKYNVFTSALSNRRTQDNKTFHSSMQVCEKGWFGTNQNANYWRLFIFGRADFMIVARTLRFHFDESGRNKMAKK